MTGPGVPPRFADRARAGLADSPRRRVAAAAAARARGVARPADWSALRDTAAAVRDATLAHLDAHLARLEDEVTRAGGAVRWARDAAEAREVVGGLTDAGATAIPAPILTEIDLACGDPTAETLVCGADFVVAETGTVVLSDDRARLALAQATTVVTVMGIEQAVPGWRDLEALLQLMPPTAGVCTWTADDLAEGRFHLVVVDNGRSRALRTTRGRQTLRCIGCQACAHVCPVHELAGPAAYGERPGPIGAILTPQLRGTATPFTASLPFASTLCGACADVCPVGIDIPGILLELRATVVEERRARPYPEALLMRGLAWSMGDHRRYEAAVLRRARWARLLSRGGIIRRLPGPLGKWTDARDLPAPPRQSFRSWWKDRTG